MSVDWTKYKAEFNAAIVRGYKQRLKSKAPMMQEVATAVLHEGDRAELVYPDGKVQEIKLKAASAEYSIKTRDLEKGDFKTVAEAIESMTTEMANTMERTLLDTLNSAPPELGGQFEAKTPEKLAESLLLKMEEMIVDFDEEGNQSTRIVVHPDNHEILAEMQKLPWFSDKWIEIIRRKYREWSARERRRELVD